MPVHDNLLLVFGALLACACRQDPYCILRVGGQQFRTRTAVDGGKNPVWNETFTFNCINENTVDFEIKVSGHGEDTTCT